MHKHTLSWYLHLILLTCSAVALITSYYYGWLDVVIIAFLLPFFLAFIGITIVTFTSSPKQHIILFFTVLGLFALFVASSTLISYTVFGLAPAISNKGLLLDRSKYSSCSWLPNVPIDWRCQDNWDESTRYLTAFNPDNHDEYIQLQIEGSMPLKNNCHNLYPVVFTLIRPSYSGITIPMRCISNDSLMYKADWNQDVDFRLVGKNVSLELFTSNLNMFGGGMFEQGSSYTTNDTYRLSPTTFALGTSKKLDLILSNSNLCREDGTLKEQINLSVDSIPINMVKVSNIDQCEIKFQIPTTNLKPGRYVVISRVNGLAQRLIDELTVTSKPLDR